MSEDPRLETLQELLVKAMDSAMADPMKKWSALTPFEKAKILKSFKQQLIGTADRYAA